MGIVSVTPRHERDGGDTSPLDKEGVIKSDRLVYDVVHTADSTKADILNNATYVLQPKAPHPDGDAYMHVVGRQLQRLSPLHSQLTYQFAAPELSIAEASPNPLNIPAKVRYSTMKQEMEIDITVLGNAIAFTTGEQPNPRLKEVVPIPLLSISRAVAFDPGNLIKAYTWTVNSDTFRGHEPGVLLMWDMEAEEITSPEFSYWMLSVQIALGEPPPGDYFSASDTWQQRVAAIGHLVMVDDPALPAPFPFPAQKNGKTIGHPVPHDPETGELDEAAIGDAEQQKWYVFNTKKTQPFNALGLLI